MLLTPPPLSWLCSSFPLSARRAAVPPTAQLASPLASAMPAAASSPTRPSAGRAGGEEQRAVVVATEVDEEPYASGLVISLKEDSERRQQREAAQQTSTETESACTTDDGAASVPSSPESADTADSANTCPSGACSSMPGHAPLLASPIVRGVPHDMHSPPPIGLLKESDVRSSSLPVLGRVLLASPQPRFGLDDVMDDFANLSPRSLHTPPRRGSYSASEQHCSVEEHEPLDALAYLHSLTSTPRSSSSYELTPSSAGTPSTPARVLLPSLPPLFTTSTAHPLTAAAVPSGRHDRVPFHVHYLHAMRQPHRRTSLYTVADATSVAAVAQAAALQAIQQRTIAAKLTASSDGRHQADEERGDEQPIIVRQPLEQTNGRKSSAAPKHTPKRKRTAVKSKSRKAGSGGRGSRAARESEKENRRPQQCEQCHRKQADTTYGTGRFCGPKCARTFSITKRSEDSTATRSLDASCSVALLSCTDCVTHSAACTLWTPGTPTSGSRRREPQLLSRGSEQNKLRSNSRTECHRGTGCMH